MSQKTKSVQIFQTILLLIVSFAMVYPLLWMVSNSFKEASTILNNPASLMPDSLDLKYFAGAFELGPIDLWIFNSAVTAFAITFFQIFLSALLAYAITYFDFKGKNFLYVLILVTYMLPTAATYVPSYVLIARMGLYDTLTGVIVSNIASVFSVFYLIQNFSQMPTEMLEAAKVEGANDWQVLWRVVMPYNRASVFTTAIINFIGMYNNYMWPALITSSESKYLISVGLNQIFTTQGNFSTNLPRLMAANTLAVVPLLIVFFVFQKYFFGGFSSSGTKG